MRVLILWTYQTSYIEAAARGLARSGHDVSIVYLPPSVAYPALPHAEDAVKRYALYKGRLPQEIQAEDWDGMLICGWHIPAYRQFARRAGSGPRLMYMDNTFRGTLKQRFFVRFGWRWLAERFDGAFVPGLRQADYAARLGYRDERIFTGGLCCDLDFGLEDADRAQGPFLFVGRLAQVKGIDDLLRAFEMYRHNGGSRRLLVAGPPDGVIPSAVDGVNWLGYQTPSEVAELMRHCAAFLLPSRFEPWGVVLLEAASAGAPLIASSAVGAADDLVTPENGVVFPAGDIEALAGAMHEVESILGPSASAASRALASHWTPEFWVERFEEAVRVCRVGSAATNASRPEFVAYLAVIPRYREACVEALLARLPGRLQLITGTAHLDRTVRTGISAERFTRVANLRLAGRALLQLGHWLPAIRARTTVVDLNPRSLTAWIILLVRRILRRRTLTWGHLYSRKGPGTRAAWARRTMRVLSSGSVLYGYGQVLPALRDLPKVPVFVAPNSLYPVRQIRTSRAQDRLEILYVGRLEAAKNVELLLRGFALSKLAARGARLSLVGHGRYLPELLSLAQSLGIEQYTTFYAETYDPGELHAHYGRAVCTVSPGYVGLSLTQSLGFGVPMVIARDELHSPEIELAKFGGVRFFEAKSAKDLAVALLAEWEQRDAIQEQREAWSNKVRIAYSAEAMADGLVAALEDTPQLLGEDGWPDGV